MTRFTFPRITFGGDGKCITIGSVQDYASTFEMFEIIYDSTVVGALSSKNKKTTSCGKVGVLQPKISDVCRIFVWFLTESREGVRIERCFDLELPPINRR